MKIGALQKFSLIDYPGKISAIVFTQGCNFRCPYCHNPELVDPELFDEPFAEDKIFSFLQTRIGKLDAVVITGGEPTIQKDLIGFIENIKSHGFLVKIDSNGSQPQVLRELVRSRLVDYIAMDVKSPLEKYAEVVRTVVDDEKIEESIGIIMDSEIDYEFRTTVPKSFLSKDDIIEIAKLIKGARLYVIQTFVAEKTLDRSFVNLMSYSEQELQTIKVEAEQYVTVCSIR
ncbi:MAG: anaerobic ribonucleoside-triphosphate reductase activating protein [Candidatus Kryptoniota bacterium]